jgi:CDP-4-dehydro-6-deoxyglucose reductase, E3
MTHRVRLADRPVAFTAEDGETVLAAGLRQHLALPFGCQSGGCGSCRVRMLEGTVHYDFEPPALSEAEKAAGYILMCQARPRSELVLELHQPARLDELRPRVLPCRVQSRAMLAHDVVGLTLKLPRDARFSYLPGQYVDVLLDDGRRRSFSLANAPNGEFIELHLRVTPQGRFAHWVLNEMPERAMLRFEGPLGAFYVREDSDRPILLMAGGTGFAPIKAMIEDQLARGGTRPLHLFWGARARRDLYQDALATQWAAQHARLRYTPVLSEPDADWQGARGLVHEALLATYPRLSAHEVYMSGPPVMVRAGKQAFTAAGLDADHLYYDSFDYAYETWPAAEQRQPL